MSEVEDKIAKIKAAELENRLLKSELQTKFLKKLEKVDPDVYPDKTRLYAEVIGQLSTPAAPARKATPATWPY